MLYYSKKDKNATEMQKKVCALYREGVVTDPTCQKWFGKFMLESVVSQKVEYNLVTE